MPQLAWLAQVVFYGAYAIGYFTNKTFTHSFWPLLTAIAAIVIAVLLITENYSTVYHRPQNQ